MKEDYEGQAEDLKNLPSIEVIEIPEDPPLYEEEPELAYQWAKDCWWRGTFSATEIAKSIDVPYSKVRKWVIGSGRKVGWRSEKKRALTRIVNKAAKRESNRIDRLIDRMLTLSENAVERYGDENYILNPGELDKQLANIERMVKLRAFLNGEPTDILDLRAKDLSWDKIKEKIKAVDIIDYEKFVPTPEKVTGG